MSASSPEMASGEMPPFLQEDVPVLSGFFCLVVCLFFNAKGFRYFLMSLAVLMLKTVGSVTLAKFMDVLVEQAMPGRNVQTNTSWCWYLRLLQGRLSSCVQKRHGLQEGFLLV